MNCKPGDMAIVICDVPGTVVGGDFDGHKASGATSGKIVRVTTLADPDPSDPMWNLEEPIQVQVVGLEGVIWARGTLEAIEDRYLRPLPPLSEDEHDQAEAGKPEQVPA